MADRDPIAFPDGAAAVISCAVTMPEVWGDRRSMMAESRDGK